MEQRILALLLAAFAGVRKDGLNQLARSLALQVDTEEQATDVVGKLTADKVNKFVSDWRREADAEISKANKTYEDGLKNKYDFVEKQKPAPTPSPAPTGELTLEAIQKLMTEAATKATAPLLDEIATLKGSKIAANRRDELVKIFGENVPEYYKNAVLEGFEGRTFADDNAFNEYLNKQKEGVATVTQELADKGLAGFAKPVFGTVNKEGVSTGVASYIQEKAEEAKGNGLGGKEI